MVIFCLSTLSWPCSCDGPTRGPQQLCALTECWCARPHAARACQQNIARLDASWNLAGQRGVLPVELNDDGAQRRFHLDIRSAPRRHQPRGLFHVAFKIRSSPHQTGSRLPRTSQERTKGPGELLQQLFHEPAPKCLSKSFAGGEGW
jgi:hypothetical protein